jgi:hypothetical protein
MKKKLLILFVAASCFALTGCTVGGDEDEVEDVEALKELLQDVAEGDGELPYGCGEGANYICCGDDYTWCCIDALEDGGFVYTCGNH